MRVSTLVICAALLSGCATQVQYKAGVTPAERNKDSAICNQAASKAYPVRIVQRRTPRYYVPGRPYCNSKGDCRYSGGYWEGGHVYSTDVNKDTRRQAYGQCMSAKGYQSVELPTCTGEQRQAAVRSVQKAYPKLSKESCAVEMKDGSVKIYTP